MSYCSCNHHCTHDSYGCLAFLLDLVLIAATGGLWIIWILIREMRKH